MLTSHKLAIAASLSALALAAGAQSTSAAAGAAQPTEAQAATGASTTPPSDLDVVRTAFRRADTNGDGKLSREEAAALPAVAEKFTQLDKDGDGFISAAEFEAGVTTQPPAAK